MHDTYTPDNWVVLKIASEDTGTFYKVLAGWSGSYLHGSSWRLNSGIVSCEDEGEAFIFSGSSGSKYRCLKDTYFLKINISYIYDELKIRYGDRVQLMPEDTDWTNFQYKVE